MKKVKIIFLFCAAPSQVNIILILITEPRFATYKHSPCFYPLHIVTPITCIFSKVVQICIYKSFSLFPSQEKHFLASSLNANFEVKERSWSSAIVISRSRAIKPNAKFPSWVSCRRGGIFSHFSVQLWGVKSETLKPSACFMQIQH